MSKRILAAFLWFFTGWTVGAMIALAFDASTLLGPVMGAVFAAMIAGDPRGIIWKPARQTEKARAVAIARLEELPATN